MMEEKPKTRIRMQSTAGQMAFNRSRNCSSLVGERKVTTCAGELE